MAEFTRTDGDFYVSKSGSNANDGSINTPFLTIDYALSQASGGDVIIVGTGTYEEYLSSGATTNQIIADGEVNLKGDGVSTTLGLGIGYGNVEGFKINGFINILGTSNQKLKRCIVVGGIIDATRAGTTQDDLSLSECVFYSCEIIKASKTSAGLSALDKNLFFSTQITFSKDSENTDINIDSCYFDSNSSFDASGFGTTGGASITFRGCHSQNADIIDPNNKITQQTPVTGTVGFKGDISRLELCVSESSSFIGNGYLGVNVGNVKVANLQNQSSLEWGLNPASTGNTAFSSGSLNLTSGTSSSRTSQTIDLGQVRRSPLLRFNGFTDFLNSVPDANNTLVNPNHITLECQWAGVDGVFNGSWEYFMWNERMRVDGTGKYTGESGYDWTNEIDIEIRYLKIRTTVRDNYNVA